MVRKVIACQLVGDSPSEEPLVAFMVSPNWETGAAYVSLLTVSPQSLTYSFDCRIERLTNFTWVNVPAGHALYSHPHLWDLDDEVTHEWPEMLNKLADSSRIPMVM